MNLNIASYNILNPVHAVKWSQKEGVEIVNGIKQSNWENGRRDRVFKCLRARKFDIACLQEVCRKTWREFQVAGFEMTQLGVNVNRHGANGDDDCDGPCIVYNSKTVELISDFNVCTAIDRRQFVYVIFKEIKTSCMIAVVSAHLKGYNPTETDVQKRRESKKRGYIELLEILACCGSKSFDAIVIAGDFNEDELEEKNYPDGLSRHELICSMGYVHDNSPNIHLQSSENGTGRKIDWIYIKIANPTYTVWNILSDPTIIPDPTASDHFVICTKLTRVL